MRKQRYLCDGSARFHKSKANSNCSMKLRFREIRAASATVFRYECELRAEHCCVTRCIGNSEELTYKALMSLVRGIS